MLDTKQMRLTDKELQISGAGSLAQRRLARGLKLNYPESIAIISSQILEFVRDGQSLDQIKELGRKLLGRNLVQKGVEKIVRKISVEATFHKDGLRIITIEDPICTENGDLDLLLHGSFLPKPNLDDFKKESKTEDFVIIGTNETIGNGDESEIYRGRIIPFKPVVRNYIVEDTLVENEEGELNDKVEDAEKMQKENKSNEDSANKNTYESIQNGDEIGMYPKNDNSPGEMIDELRKNKDLEMPENTKNTPARTKRMWQKRRYPRTKINLRKRKNKELEMTENIAARPKIKSS